MTKSQGPDSPTEAAAADSLRSFLETLPPVDYAFAYGSAVFPQGAWKREGREGKNSMTDYILAVNSPIDWHNQNLSQNRDHYRSAWVRARGGARVSWLAEEIGAGVHFNPYVHGGHVKYGVVSMDALTRDLCTWDRLYISGRMQKPIRELSSNPKIADCQHLNLRAALAAALLSLPTSFSERDLFQELCSLSYSGDIRTMVAAEDVNKVSNIVDGNLPGFRDHYSSQIAELKALGLLTPEKERASEGNSLAQDTSHESRTCLLSKLPLTILRRMGHGARRMQEPLPSKGPFVSSLVYKGHATNDVMRKALRRVVFVSSARQALAGLVTSGLSSSVSYVGRKLWESITSRIRMNP